MAPGAAAITTANSTSVIIAARSFQRFRKSAFTFRRTFNLDLPKTQVGSGTKWYWTRKKISARNFDFTSRELFILNPPKPQVGSVKKCSGRGKQAVREISARSAQSCGNLVT